jgi:hypothetical protein
VKRPAVTVTFPDGCAVTYSHPEDERFPRADLVPAPDHTHIGDDDSRISQAVGRAFLEALSHSIYEAKVGEPVVAAPSGKG